MRSITTAAAFAIAASLAAGQDEESYGKSGKSGTVPSGTKSSKSGDCTDCSVDTLTRATTATSLSFETYGNEDGELDYQSLLDFCCNKDERDAFLEAVEFISGCLVYTDCLVAQTFAQIGDPFSNTTIAEGGFLIASVNEFCSAEQIGEKLPPGGDCPTPDELCAPIVNNLGACVVEPDITRN